MSVTTTAHVRAFPLADPGLPPHVAMALPGLSTASKTQQTPPNTIPHTPSGKGINSSQARPGQGQITFSVSATTVCEVKKATKPHTQSANSRYLITSEIYMLGRVQYTQPCLYFVLKEVPLAAILGHICLQDLSPAILPGERWMLCSSIFCFHNHRGIFFHRLLVVLGDFMVKKTIRWLNCPISTFDFLNVKVNRLHY